MSPTRHDALRLGVPKGSLQEPTIDLFRRAGYDISVRSRSYEPDIDVEGVSCVMFRAQEMARYVADGVIDVGITGRDWIEETGADVHEVCELSYSRATDNPVRWVLAVPEESPVQGPKDLEGGLIATELLSYTERYFAKHGVKARVEFSWGATEVKARLVDAIVDVTETGSSLRANKLRIVDTLMTSTTRLVCNHEAWADAGKRRWIEDLATLLRGAIAARSRVGLKMNVAEADKDAVLSILGEGLPESQSPTVNALHKPGWYAVEVVLEARVERELLPRLRRAGASALFTYPLNKVIP
ncbi:MAG: ATP phosphoribosyltransferase [Planctomycetota bacterium]